MPNAHDNAARPSADQNDAGKLVLRVVLGLLILCHGVSKLIGGIGPVTGALGKAGLPPALAYLVFIGEVLAPILLIVGVWTRPAALIVAINMIVVVVLVHTSQLFTMTKNGGYGLELQAMYLFAAIAVAMLGAGRYSAGGNAGRWN